MDDLVPTPRRRKHKAKPAEAKVEDSAAPAPAAVAAAAPPATAASPVVTKAADQQPQPASNVVDFSVAKHEEKSWNQYAKLHDDDSNDEDWVMGAPVAELKGPRTSSKLNHAFIHTYTHT